MNNFNLYKLVYQYQKVFYNFLIETLPFEQDVKHTIKTRNPKPININVYLSSKTYIEKKIAQVTNLLNKRLI